MGIHFRPTMIGYFIMFGLPSVFLSVWVYWLYQLDYSIYTLCLLFILGLWISSSIAMAGHVYLCYRTAPQRQAD